MKEKLKKYFKDAANSFWNGWVIFCTSVCTFFYVGILVFGGSYQITINNPFVKPEAKIDSVRFYKNRYLECNGNRKRFHKFLNDTIK